MSPTDRRSRPDRRVVPDRRAAEAKAPPAEPRPSSERRGMTGRRSGVERRGRETVEEHLRNALQLLSNIAETGSLDDETRRDLDAAMFRLRFAVDRLRHDTT
ncbi:MAG TPA: hypothetical protein VLV16_08380 [Gemmatimonadales bacterium]|nr:hypothetical protein [Gemmatimonadales bacterium]